MVSVVAVGNFLKWDCSEMAKNNGTVGLDTPMKIEPLSATSF